MQGNYALLINGERVGMFYIDSSNDLVRYKIESDLKKQPILFQLVINKFGVLQDSVAYTWIINRVPESNAEFINALMDRVGIKEYDAFAFVEYNSGRFNTDEFYLEKVE